MFQKCFKNGIMKLRKIRKIKMSKLKKMTEDEFNDLILNI